MRNLDTAEILISMMLSYFYFASAWTLAIHRFAGTNVGLHASSLSVQWLLLSTMSDVLDQYRVLAAKTVTCLLERRPHQTPVG